MWWDQLQFHTEVRSLCIYSVSPICTLVFRSVSFWCIIGEFFSLLPNFLLNCIRARVIPSLVYFLFDIFNFYLSFTCLPVSTVYAFASVFSFKIEVIPLLTFWTSWTYLSFLSGHAVKFTSSEVNSCSSWWRTYLWGSVHQAPHNQGSCSKVTRTLPQREPLSHRVAGSIILHCSCVLSHLGPHLSQSLSSWRPFHWAPGLPYSRGSNH